MSRQKKGKEEFSYQVRYYTSHSFSIQRVANDLLQVIEIQVGLGFSLLLSVLSPQTIKQWAACWILIYSMQLINSSWLFLKYFAQTNRYTEAILGL